MFRGGPCRYGNRPKTEKPGTLDRIAQAPPRRIRQHFKRRSPPYETTQNYTFT
jgi:hypothetical protein